ncbi:hypothetical protein [Bacillus wiedmannii]|uniref:hypothetical protein n=1 Tax=Bacillus wiedmannii TaxID=1890302 RepID=UPI000BFBE733|nr:hypothetical protein [Bacillus wiedmannii]PHA62889.1 hypothetical protein COE75_16785 [Bacillus wiedmannii]
MTNQNIELRQLSNSVEIVGTLKSKELEVKTSQNGNPYMSGKLVVQSVVDNKINEQTIKVFVMQSSKLFKGIDTVRTEYKTIDKDGKEAADRIKVTGELTLNEYYNNQGTLVQFNEIKGVFYNRLDAANDQPDKAIASIETIVESFVEKMDKDQLPTGEYSVNGFTVAWGSNVVELRNVIIGAELAQPFMDLYQPGSTGRLSFKLNNYVEVEEKEVEEPAVPTHGFGSTETVEGSNIIKNFVNNIEIIGGDVPFFGTKEYTPEEIDNAKKVRDLKLQTLQAPAPETPQTNTGFGHGAPSDKDVPPVTDADMPGGMTNNEDMPDF